MASNLSSMLPWLQNFSHLMLKFDYKKLKNKIIRKSDTISIPLLFSAATCFLVPFAREIWFIVRSMCLLMGATCLSNWSLCITLQFVQAAAFILKSDLLHLRYCHLAVQPCFSLQVGLNPAYMCVPSDWMVEKTKKELWHPCLPKMMDPPLWAQLG